MYNKRAVLVKLEKVIKKKIDFKIADGTENAERIFIQGEYFFFKVIA